MNKDEFLQKLQESLSGEVPPEIVRENLQYYGGYIRDERKKGRSETEIMEELGDPRMIAHTIIDTTPGGGGNFEEYTGGFSYGDRGYTSGQEDSAGQQDSGSYGAGMNQQNGSFHVYDLNKWYYKALGVVILIAVFTVIIAVVSGILTLLIPMLPVILVVMILMWFLRGL